MGRIRTIKPEFFHHSGLYDAEQETSLPLRLAFAGLWTCCDREGRFKWRPRELKLAVLPYDELDFSRVLDALVAGGFIVKYTSGSEVFGCVPAWKTHQFINNKEPKSELPNHLPNQSVDASVTREVREVFVIDTRGVKEGKGKEEERRVEDTSDLPITDPSLAAHILAAKLGDFDMHSERAYTSMLEASSRQRSVSLETSIEDYSQSWQAYSKATADGKLNFPKQSAYTFLMSGTALKPEAWPWKPEFKPQPKRVYANGAAK